MCRLRPLLLVLPDLCAAAADDPEHFLNHAALQVRRALQETQEDTRRALQQQHLQVSLLQPARNCCAACPVNHHAPGSVRARRGLVQDLRISAGGSTTSRHSCSLQECTHVRLRRSKDAILPVLTAAPTVAVLSCASTRQAREQQL